MFRPVRGLWFAAILTVTAPTVLLGDWAIHGPAEADAAVSVAYSLDELVAASPQAAVVKAVEQRSEWEEIGDSKRIVTYTKVERVESVYGSVPETLWVRTLGGAVGRIGQHVAGEAQFTTGKESLVFFTQTPRGTFVVSGAAQGHYPIVVSDDERTLALSPNRGKIVRKKSTKTTVQEALGGVQVTSGVSKVKSARTRVDGKKKKQK
jgi:hypothetical protein